MGLIVWRSGPHLYMAEASPPHAPAGLARTTAPLPRDALVRYLEALGVPMADIWEALKDSDRA